MVENEEEQQYYDFIRTVYCQYYLTERRDVASEGAVILFERDKAIAEVEVELITAMGCCPVAIDVMSIPEPPNKATDSTKLCTVRRVNRVCELYNSAVAKYLADIRANAPL